MKIRTRTTRLVASTMAVALLATACASDDGEDTGDDAAAEETTDDSEDSSEDSSDEEMDEEADGGEAVSGSIEIDGSSTVGPLTDAIAEEYAAVQPDVTVNLSISGSGGGFERFCNVGDTDISNASRPIKQDEIDACADAGIEFIEVRVGVDALTMATQPGTDFLECLTTDEIVKLWGPEDPAETWDEVNPDFPSDEVAIFAPGADSGTYDFFNETTLEPNGFEGPRQDYNGSEDDNIIAQGIIGTPNSWGYFGFAYYNQNVDQLQAVAYDAGDGCVLPSEETAQDGSYQLTRPLFIYVKEASLEKPQVADFVTFYLDTVNDVIDSVGYIAATDDEIAEAREKAVAAIEAAA